MLNKAFYIILFLSLSCCVQAQKIMRNTSLLNSQRGDRTVLHFGFSLGINYMDYKAVLSGANGWRAESGKLDWYIKMESIICIISITLMAPNGEICIGDIQSART